MATHSITLTDQQDRRREEQRARMRAMGQMARMDPGEAERLRVEGQERYGPFAPYPCRMSPKDVKFKRREHLPRIRGVGEVDREERLEALRRLGLHCSGEEPITEFGELDRVARVLMQVPRAHAVTFHANIVKAMDDWIRYAPCGRGTVGASRKAYMKMRQFVSVLKP